MLSRLLPDEAAACTAICSCKNKAQLPLVDDDLLGFADCGTAMLCVCCCRALRSQLEMPVLVLHGEGDAALSVKLLDGIEAVAPHSTVKVLKNCSHW